MLNRYEWEDALIGASEAGVLKDGALLVALKLAKVIHWNPKDGRPSGLYWKNMDAFEAVGIARATFFRHRESLFETGFLSMTNGNLIPSLPKSQIETVEQSQNETLESQVETNQSQVETTESQVDNPYTVDTYTEDSFSEDTYTLNAAAVAAEEEIVDRELRTLEDDSSSSVSSSIFRPSRSEGGPAGIETSSMSLRESSSIAVKNPRQSQLETGSIRAYGAEMVLTIKEHNRNFAEPMNDEELQEVIDLACSTSFHPDVTNIGARVGKAFYEINTRSNNYEAMRI